VIRETGTLVLGVGNPLRGDDGAGPAVVEWLRGQGAPDGVALIDGGTAGLDLVTALAGYRRALIVDAAAIGRAPGEWLRFTVDALRPADGGPTLSLHEAGLGDALRLAEALGVLPEQVAIYGVQPARVDWSPGLSDEVQCAVPSVGRALLQELV
jgi:hydrogenase maturation protease